MSTELWREALRRGPDCLPTDQLAATDLSAADRYHLEHCPYCQGERALLRDFEDPTVSADEAAAVNWISRRLEERKSEITGLVPANPAAPKARLFDFHLTTRLASAALLIVTGAVIQQRSAVTPEISSGASHQTLLRSESVALIAPLGTLANAPVELTWQAVRGATHYRVRVTEVDGTLVWEDDAAATSVAVPANVRQRALAFKTLEWEVSAAKGTATIASGRGKFRVEP